MEHPPKQVLQQQLETLDEEIWDIRDHLYERMMARAAIANIIKEQRNGSRT